MKNKVIKKVAIIIGIIILVWVIFFTTDYIRVKNNKTPIFCININGYDDGGTQEYLGLGYKVIDYNRFDGYDDIKIGTWSMGYEVKAND